MTSNTNHLFTRLVQCLVQPLGQDHDQDVDQLITELAEEKFVEDNSLAFPYGLYNWRAYVPHGVKQAWPELSDESRIVARIFADTHALDDELRRYDGLDW